MNESDAMKSLEWMHDNCEELAKVEAKVEMLKEYLKVEDAKLYRSELNTGKTVSEKAAWVTAHPTHKEFIDYIVKARETMLYLKLKFKSNEATIEVWRTMQANARVEARVL